MKNKKLGEKIRFHRKLLHLSQKELAEKLYVTPQNLSKWEKGLSNPDIWNLLRIAEALSVSCDYLLAQDEGNRPPKILLAVDGGATKTEFLLFYETGEVLKRFVLPGSNPNSCGMEKTLSVLKNGIDSFLTCGRRLHGAFLGIAGCGNQKNQKRVLSFLRETYPDVKFDVQSDLYNVVHSKIPAKRYISVICGTGSVVGVKTPEEGISTIGGFGYLFDNAFCGYTLGKEAILATLRCENGIGKDTLISQLIEKKLHSRALENIDTFYENGKEYIASFAHVVFEAFDKGDEVAKNIIDKSIAELGALITDAAKKYGNIKDVVLHGGVTKRNDICISELQKYCGDMNISVCELDQIYGAAIYCSEIFADMNDDMINNLKKSIERR